MATWILLGMLGATLIISVYQHCKIGYLIEKCETLAYQLENERATVEHLDKACQKLQTELDEECETSRGFERRCGELITNRITEHWN